jgi:hypothetical protein
MRVLNWAAAGLFALLVGASSAMAEQVSPFGPNNEFDYLLPIPAPYNAYSGSPVDYSMTVTFDPSAFVSLEGHYEILATIFAMDPCPGGQGCHVFIDPGLQSGGTFDWRQAGALDPYMGAKKTQITWEPLENGFTLNFYRPDSCLPRTNYDVCYELYRLSRVSLYGQTLTSDPVNVEVTFGAAAPRAVPEPATWAMMILGFGLIGATARSRRGAAAAAA